MFKKLFSLFFCIAIVPVFAMKKSRKKNASSIQVTTINQNFEVFFHPTSTILDIKNIIETTEGVPIDQQNLLAVGTNYLVFQKHSSSLDNRFTIKEVMNLYNTNHFKLQKLKTKKRKLK